MLKNYPRPQFERKEWINLNGSWKFEFDDSDLGVAEKWFDGKQLSRTINVPYVYESELSGIGEKTPHKFVWYARELNVPKQWMGKRVFLRFGAVDYIADVYINGHLAATHVGGNTSFDVELTDFLNYDKDVVYVRVTDDPENEFQARGKQFWEAEPRIIWYTRSTGIWQSVYMECTEKTYLTGYEVYPDVDAGRARFLIGVNEVVPDTFLEIDVTLKGEQICLLRTRVQNKSIDVEADIFRKKIMNTSVHGMGLCWSPENPVLFDVELRLYRGDILIDSVNSYFGMRKIRAEKGEIWLNNHLYPMRLVLDQGYFKDGLLTPESDDALEKDILLSKAMGFNGCRKHQKVECELFHYYADKLGFLVFGEMASCINFDEFASATYTQEWAESVRQRFNHPSIVAWVPINESWGVPDLRTSEQQRHLLSALYHFTKSLDGTRPVISNDGWEMAETDIIAIHSYAHGASGETAKHKRYAEDISTRENLIGHPSTNRAIFIDGYGDNGQPILLSEMGGVSFGMYAGRKSYGYCDVENEADFLAFLRRVFGAVYASKALKGFCYTQFADVEQEINGLVTEDRKPKAPMEMISKIIKGEEIGKL